MPLILWYSCLNVIIGRIIFLTNMYSEDLIKK